MTLLLLQMTIVLATSLLCGNIARRLGQSRVIGEIVGGILLGPSVLGRSSPGLSARIFPSGSLGSLDVLSTVGLILFLFMIGSELDLEHLRQQKSTATLSSFASILLPFSLAVIAAPLIHTRFAPNEIGRLPFALFLGVSLSITAFPVLARILEERNLQTDALGATALLCAAVDDVTAWMLLALAITFLSANGNDRGFPVHLVWLVVYVAAMLLLVKPATRRFSARRASAPLSYELLGVMLAFALASSAVTDAIGAIRSSELFWPDYASLACRRGSDCSATGWTSSSLWSCCRCSLPSLDCEHAWIFSPALRRGCGQGSSFCWPLLERWEPPFWVRGLRDKSGDSQSTSAPCSTHGAWSNLSY